MATCKITSFFSKTNTIQSTKRTSTVSSYSDTNVCTDVVVPILNDIINSALNLKKLKRKHTGDGVTNVTVAKWAKLYPWLKVDVHLDIEFGCTCTP